MKLPRTANQKSSSFHCSDAPAAPVGLGLWTLESAGSDLSWVLITEASPWIWLARSQLQNLHWLIWRFQLVVCNCDTHFQVTAITFQISLYRSWPMQPSDPSQCRAAPQAFPVLPTCPGVLSSRLAWHQHTHWDPTCGICEGTFLRLSLQSPPTPHRELLNDAGACTWHHFLPTPAGAGQQPLPVVLLIQVTTTDTDWQGTAVTNT